MAMADDGGAAFPTPKVFGPRDHEDNEPAVPGMSLREFFAAHAPPLPEPMLRDLLRQVQEKYGTNAADAVEVEKTLGHCLARWAFRYADAMLNVARKAP